MRNAGQVLTRGQIADHVWNYESSTVLEQRVGAMLERFRLTKRAPAEIAVTAEG